MKSLAESFTSIRRCQPQDQLDLSMTPTQLKHNIKYTIQQMKGKSNRQCYADEAALTAAMDPKIFYTKFEDMPILCWDLALGVKPSLKTGQHRRLALISRSKLPEYDATQEITEESKMVSLLLASSIGRSI